MQAQEVRCRIWDVCCPCPAAAHLEPSLVAATLGPGACSGALGRVRKEPWPGLVVSWTQEREKEDGQHLSVELGTDGGSRKQVGLGMGSSLDTLTLKPLLLQSTLSPGPSPQWYRMLCCGKRLVLWRGAGLDAWI
jgi:hypothetical protein